MAGGYDYKWIEDPPDELKCSICLTVARDPKQHGDDGCGSVFCTGCVMDYRWKTENCPICRQDMTLFRDKRSDRNIKALKIKCSNTDKGCMWEGELGRLEEHHQSCDYITTSCKYAQVGCKEIHHHKDIKGHEENHSLRLPIAMERLFMLTKQSEAEKCQLRFKVTGYKQLREDGDFFSSPCFYTSPNGYKMRIEIRSDYDDNEVTPLAQVEKGDNDDFLTWTCNRIVTIEVLNQLEDKNHYKATMTFDGEGTRLMDEKDVNDPLVFIDFVSHTDLAYKPYKNCQYLKDDTLFLRVYVEVPDLKPWLDFK